MALVDDVKVAYKAVVRADLNDTVAAAVAASITNGTTTLDAYIASLIQQNTTTTGASVAIAAFVTGVTPTSDKLNALKVEADKQVASYTAMKVANPALGAFEAFGKGFAEDASTGFATKYGALSTADFISTVYISVFGTTPAADAAANLTAQINFFTKLYTDAKLANPALLAKGAVLGQIVGYAFIDPAFSSKATIDNAVSTFLTAAAKGDTTGYGKALPPVSGSGTPGAILTLTNVAGGDVVDPTQTVLSLKSTDGDDTIRGLAAGDFASADVINGAGGFDTLNAEIGAATVAAAMTSVERANIKATNAAATFDASATKGLQQLWTDTGSTAALIATSIDNSVTLGAKGAWGITATLKNTSGTADVAKLAVDGATAGAAFTINGIETAQLSVISNSVISVDSDKLTSVEVSGKGNLSLDITAAGLANLTSVKAASLTGDLTFAETEVKDLTIEGSTGINIITLAGNKKNTITTLDGNDSIITGTGDDTIKTGGGNNAVNAGDGKNSVTGGAGDDSITTGAGDDTIVTGDGTNTVNTGNGVNTVTGGAGNDTIVGGTGKDTIDVGAGKNTVTGNGGADAITFGAGADTALFLAFGDSKGSSLTAISGFASGTDKVDVKAFDGANTLTNQAGLNNAQAAVNALAPAATLTDALNAALGAGKIDANQNGYFTFKGDSYVVVQDGAGAFADATDFVVKLTGVTGLQAADLVIA